MHEKNERKLYLSVLSKAYISTFKALKKPLKSLRRILFPADTNASDIERLINYEIMKYLKPKYMIVMLGSTNAGKSTLMNRMLQVPMLASSEQRETDSVYLVEFAREKVS
jgi:ribosome biogenesis GTPase A